METKQNIIQRIKSTWAILPKWPRRILLAMFFLFLFADFIANDKPLYCKVDGQHYFPVLKNYMVNMGAAKWDSKFLQVDWKTLDYDAVVYPPIPYHPKKTDLRNANCVSPFGPQKVESKRFWHVLGTDDLGRDIAAGMIHGVRIALLIGFVSMLIAGILGFLLGSLAGYYGDDKVRMTWGRAIILFLVKKTAFVYTVILPFYNGLSIFWILLLFIASMLLIGILNKLLIRLEEKGIFKRDFAIPFDLLLMRLIEIFRSIPALFILLAVLAILKTQSVYNIMFIIGLFAWPGIARFVRAEILKIREMEYVKMAESMGYSDGQIILKHVLPNALGPALIAIAFGFAAAILLESSLSFLGIGLNVNEVTWGSILNLARTNFSAWWLAIFPGLAIFMTIYIFNRFGDSLAENLKV